MSAHPKYDIVVIGAGIEGSATAYFLAKNGHKTLLLEQFNLPHTRGSSHGQSRITRKAYPQHYYAVMMHEAFNQWQELENETGVNLYKKTGLLCFGPDKHPTIVSTRDALKRIGADYKMLSGAQSKKEFPMFDMPDDFSAVYDPMGGMLRADKCLVAYQAMFKQYGGTIHDMAKVTDIFPGDTVTIFTTRGNYSCNRLVITAGPWTNDLLKPLGLTLPLKPIRIAVCYWKENFPEEKDSGSFAGGSGAPAFVSTPNDGVMFGYYGLPDEEYPGLVKICMHDGPEIHPDRRDAVVGQTTDRDMNTLQKFVRRHFPSLEDRPSVQESCIYTMTPDEDYILDCHPTWQNIVIGAGFSGHGFKLAPVVGRILGELATKRPPTYDLSPFRISRFSSTGASSKL